MRQRLVGTDHHNDERFFELSRDARYIYGHLLTHPQMTSFGLIRLTVGGLADECGLERGECQAALEQLVEVGRVEADRMCLALDESYLEKPANPSVIAGWGKILDLLPQTALVQQRLSLAVEQVKARARRAGKTGESWTDAIPKRLRERLVAPVIESKPGKSPVPTSATDETTTERAAAGKKTTQETTPRKPAAKKAASVKRFPVVVAGGPATSSTGSTTSTSTRASTVYVTASGPAPLVMTSSAPVLADPDTLEVDPIVEEGAGAVVEDPPADLLDADELFALIDPPRVEEPVEVEPVAEPTPARDVDDSPYTLPAVGLLPPPEPPMLPTLSELASPAIDETADEGVEEGVGHGVEHGVGEGVGHPVPHGVEHGVRHPVGEGVEHGAGHGVAHSIFHLPSSNFQLPQGGAGWLRRARAREQAREARCGDGSQVELEFEFEVEDTDGTIIELPDDPPDDDPPVVEYFDDPSPPPMEGTELDEEPDEEPDPDEESALDEEPEPDLWFGAEPEASSDPAPDFWPEPEGELDDEARSDADDPEPESPSEPEPEPEHAPCARSGSDLDAEPEIQLEPEPDSNHVPGTAFEPELDTESDSETGPDFESEPNDPDSEADYRALLTKAEGILGRNLEVEELDMLRTWCRDIPQRLIESALADGMRAKIRRLSWVGKRLETLVEGHLAKHPELAEDDLAKERADALRVLSDDRLSGHLSPMTRKLATAYVRKATSARQVRDILDQALES